MNRIFQILLSYATIGLAPVPGHDDPIAFSHVDTVADAILAIMRSPTPPGTFHVESPHEIGIEEIVDALAAQGFQIAFVPPATYASRVEASPVAAAAAVWLGLPKRNVHMHRSRTLDLLERLGVSFNRPDQAWLTLLFSRAIEDGLLPTPNLDRLRRLPRGSSVCSARPGADA